MLTWNDYIDKEDRIVNKHHVQEVIYKHYNFFSTSKSVIIHILPDGDEGRGAIVIDNLCKQHDFMVPIKTIEQAHKIAMIMTDNEMFSNQIYTNRDLNYYQELCQIYVDSCLNPSFFKTPRVADVVRSFCSTIFNEVFPDIKTLYLSGHFVEKEPLFVFSNNISEFTQKTLDNIYPPTLTTKSSQTTSLF